MAAKKIKSNKFSATQPLQELVDEGVRLSRIVREGTEDVEEIKVLLREAAKAEATKGIDPPIVFLGETGSASVSFPKDKMVTAEGKKLAELKELLPVEVYANLFDEELVVKPVKDFAEKVLKLNTVQQTVLAQYFARKPSTPSVEFSK